MEGLKILYDRSESDWSEIHQLYKDLKCDLCNPDLVIIISLEFSILLQNHMYDLLVLLF